MVCIRFLPFFLCVTRLTHQWRDIDGNGQVSLSTRTPAGIQTEKIYPIIFWLNAWSNYTRDFRFDIKSRGRRRRKKWDFKRGDSFGTLNRPRERHPLYLVPTWVENGSSLRDQRHVPMISMQARMNFFFFFLPKGNRQDAVSRTYT